MRPQTAERSLRNVLRPLHPKRRNISSRTLAASAWPAVAYMTTPTDRSTLLSFYKLVRPAGPGWASIRAEAGVGASQDSLPLAMLGWVCGVSFIYSALFGVGSFLYGRTSLAIFWTAVFVGTGLTLLRLMPKLWKS